MGHVKIDIHRADRNYYHTSLSTKDDVYDIINTLDGFIHDANKGNYEALITLIDFSSLLEKNKVMVEYFKILTGKDGYKPNKNGGTDDYGKTILELVSERLEISKTECEEIFNDSINGIVDGNLELWLKWVNKNFKGKYKVKKKGKYQYKCDKDSSFYQLDFNKKYVVNNKMYKELGYPQDVQELIDTQKKNQDKIKELEQLKKDKIATKEQKNQLKKRIRFNIDLWQDINILKKHYNIEIKNNMVKEQTNFVSYSDKDLETEEQDYFNSILDELNIEKIKETAQKVLTDKQLVIFNLYYISQTNQQEIADLLDETQGNISRDLKTSLEKIRKNI